MNNQIKFWSSFFCLIFSANVSFGQGGFTTSTPIYTLSDVSIGKSTTTPGVKLELSQQGPADGFNVLLKLRNNWVSSGGMTRNEPTILYDAGGAGIMGGLGWAVSARVSDVHYFRIGMYQGSPSIYKEFFRIAENGNVGIGTTCLWPDAKLAVNGKIAATSVSIKLPNANGCFPDYVFAPGYKLLSLQEVEDYIKINKHLPEIPSAQEVDENGLDVAQMDVLLLKKVEELTLYTIEQEKQINLLKEEMNQIKLEQKIQDTIELVQETGNNSELLKKEEAFTSLAAGQEQETSTSKDQENEEEKVNLDQINQQLELMKVYILEQEKKISELNQKLEQVSGR